MLPQQLSRERPTKRGFPSVRKSVIEEGILPSHHRRHSRFLSNRDRRGGGDESESFRNPSAVTPFY